MRVRVYRLFHEATVRLLFQFDTNRLRAHPQLKIGKKGLLDWRFYLDRF